MMAAILNFAILKLAILESSILVFPLKLTHTCQDWFPPFTQKNFTHSFWLNLMIVAILYSAILNLDTLESAISVFPLQLIHTCQDWFPSFSQEKLHSFILTQLDDGSHLEFCHVESRHCHLGFSHLVIFSQIHSKTLSLHSDSDSN